MKDSLSSLALMLVCSSFVVVATGCENPNPLAPVDPIGEYPVWGADFGEDKIKKAADSLLGEKAGHDSTKDGAASSDPKVAAAGKEAAAGKAPSKETLVAGRTAFLNNCARCHGPEGKGMEVAMIGKTANLQSPQIMGKSDADLTNTILRGKGNMPAFAGQLPADQISAVLTWLRAGAPKPE